jgi:hypothetical protein
MAFFLGNQYIYEAYKCAKDGYSYTVVLYNSCTVTWNDNLKIVVGALVGIRMFS